jgi:hypothetical protein
MTQLLAVAIAAFFLGVGMAGEPFAPLHALLAITILLLGAAVLDRRSTPLIAFLFGMAGVLLTCYLQHSEIYPGTGIVGLGLGALAAATLGRRTAPMAVAVLGTLVGTGLFFLL